MKRILIFFIAIIINSYGLFAQSYTVQGTVVDETNQPLIGVTVKEKGTGVGAATTDKGNFSLQVKGPNSVLLFSYLGYEQKELVLNGENTVKVVLVTDLSTMDEVVVVGYGTMKRRDLTGSVSSIDGDALSRAPVVDVTSALVGQSAGMQVSSSEGAPGAGISIKIRGGGSITQSNEPLYVIDGFPQTEGLSSLDPMDIESIDILKDASATAIYGARGANGVVLVTTKKGKGGQTRVNYDMYYGVKKITNTLAMLDPYEYVIYDYERSLKSEEDLNKFTNRYGAYDELESLYLNKPGIDWQNELFGSNVNNQYHKIGATGGSENTQFNLFYSFNNDEGIMVNSGAKKNNAKLSLSHTANEKLKINGSINYTQQEIYGAGTSEGGDRFNKLQNILQYRPTIGKSGIDSDLLDLDEDPALLDDEGNVMQNPLTNAIAETRKRDINNLYLNTSLDYKIFKNLSYRGMVGMNSNNLKVFEFNGSRSVNAKRTGGPNGAITDTKRNSWNYSNTLTYSNTINQKHSLNVLLGQEELYSESELLGASAQRFPNDDIGLNDLSQGSLSGIPRSFYEDERMISFFSRVNYSYLDRYLFTASLRADGSSKFGSGNKYGYFPSAAFAWKLIEEDFLKTSELLSDFKFRASYGHTGNNRISNYLSLALLEAGNYPLNNSPSISLGSRTLPNPNLKWETTKSMNLGLDIGFLNEKIHFTVDVYNNKTEDLLLAAEVPYSSGYNTVQMNIGSTRNRGLELALNTRNMVKQDFQWTTNFNLTFNKNKVLSLIDGQEFFYSEASYGALNESDYLVKVGKPVGLMFGYQSEGLYQVSDFDYESGEYKLKAGIPFNPNNKPQPGYLKLSDINNDGLITSSDRTIIGNANPVGFGGLTNTFSYKAFDLSILLNWVWGNDVYNANKLANSQTHLAYRNTYEYFKDRWSTIDNTGNRITDPAQLSAINEGKTIPVYNGTQDLKFYDRMVEDGSFLRINNVSLGYTFPDNWISKVKINSLRVYVTGYNLYTFTNYSGFDPEVNSRSSNGVTPGVDFGAYPRSRSFVFGINVSL